MDAGLGSKHLKGRQIEATHKVSLCVHVRIVPTSMEKDKKDGLMESVTLY